MKHVQEAVWEHRASEDMLILLHPAYLERPRYNAASVDTYPSDGKRLKRTSGVNGSRGPFNYSSETIRLSGFYGRSQFPWLRYRNVTICARVQGAPGSNRPPPTPLVTPFSAAH